jgi:GNAT superfamily N-acetyltransferase
MGIRKATIDDEASILNLLDQLGYPGTSGFLTGKMSTIIDDPNAELLVFEEGKNVIAFISIHFVTQLGLMGDLAWISYFAVDHASRRKGIGKMMEEYCVKLAKQRKCTRIELHCSEHRREAHKFYYRQGYKETTKHFRKVIDNM